MQRLARAKPKPASSHGEIEGHTPYFTMRTDAAVGSREAEAGEFAW
jgi:hypothetical protein